MKNRLKILASIIATASFGISIATSVALTTSNLTTSNSSVLVNSTTRNNSDSDLVPAQANGQNANISTNAGPITFNNNVITALDWYGNKIWQIDMSEKVPANKSGNNTGQYLGSWKRAWFNWDYNRSSNILWVLGYGYNSNQSIYGINADTGKFVYEKVIGYVGNDNGSQVPYKFVTALSSGNVLIYGGASKNYDASGVIYNPKENTIKKFSGNSASKLTSNLESGYTAGNYRWYFYNLIPLASGINLAEIVTFDNKQSGTSGDESSKNASYNVYGLLVDDNLNFIGDQQSSDSVFRTPYKLASGMTNFRNTTITPQRDYFTLLNSQTVSVTYNTVTLFNTSNVNDIKISKVEMTNSKWIQTWTVDSNDNLYFKFLNDGKVYKIDGDTLKSGSTNFSPITYLDLSSVTSNDKVKQDANNFLIYNVYGYTGQLMMIDASYYNQINIYDEKNKLDTNKNWGLAIAVVPNKNDTKYGDFYGVLNGSDSVQTTADFTIDNSVLSTKIPSEITKSDIKLLNGAFFKEGDTKPFIISDIDDNAGTFKVTANLYKIPWFSSTLPTNAVPKVVTYTFGTNESDKGKAESITKKVSWKDLNTSTDYDFMNMLPSNVKDSDLYALNPFQPSFQSQTITNSDGTQLYPKTTYSIQSADDKTGKIIVNVEYQYVPMSASYTDGKDKSYNFGGNNITEKQVLTYKATHEYTIFNNTNNSSFYFMGATTESNDSTTEKIDVTQVPQLKSLLEAGTLPSSFLSLNNSNDSTNSSFLQFVNTTSSKGYPISKMNFNVTADDTNGILTISATMPKEYSPDQKEHTYKVEYTGLNKQSSYSFEFKSPSEINDIAISNILPSSIDEGDIIKNFITYSGFDSNDFNVVLTPDDENGTLNVQINLNTDYAKVIGNGNGFTNYSINKTFTGFMTTDKYNNRFNISFKGDDDVSLLNLKSIQTSELETAFGTNGKGSLTIKDITYNSLNEFVQKLLVSSQGSSIPSDWSASDSGVTTQVYVDNSLGIASFYVNIKQNKLPGSSSDLNFVVTYTGFVKGNEVKTNDNLSFVSDKMLKNYLLSIGAFNSEQIQNLTVDQFVSWLNTNNNITKLITYKTGEYETKLQDKNQYTLTIAPNSIQSTVTITINFGKMSNPDSLSEYSIQYTI